MVGAKRARTAETPKRPSPQPKGARAVFLPDTGYEKTILSDLQSTWQCLRQEVAENPGFDGWERALFHIDDAMRWESVRNFRHMQRSLLLVRNILQQADVPDGVTECLDEVSALMSIIWSSR